jgi:hypothetical protein
MALFRRRSEPVEEPGEARGVEPDTTATEPAEEAAVQPEEAPAGEGAYDRGALGPYDESEADRADQSIVRLDLESLLIPGLPGIGVQVEADPNSQQVRAVTAVGQEAAVQVQAFAAPRSEGLWDEIRAEMLAELSATDGARVAEAVGSFGPELRAVVPARTPEGKQVQQPLRFTGIDGPRWFLRAVFLGRAAVEPDPTDVLHTLVHQIIVVRGPDAMAPRDPLPLRLPEAAPEEAAPEGDEPVGEEEQDEGGDRFGGIDPFERGPEITEVR